MSSIGPQLPPSPQKRKHTPELDDSSPSSKAQRTTGPVANPNTDEIDLEDGSDDDYGPAPPAPAPAAAPSKGPPLPPASASPTAQPPTQNSSSDSEDDYGPALPSASGAPIIGPSMPPAPSTGEEAAPQRDDWMLAPPPSGGPFTERDTTKIRARKFTSGKSAGAKGGGGGGGEVNSMWTETPEQKLARLQDAVLGRSTGGAQQDGGAGGDDSVREKEQEERNRRIAANIEGSRGRSLVEEHTKQRKESGKADEDDDDPSKRGFDREKDMALGGRLASTQRKELLNKSANFGGRFSKGSFL
ncbi:Protein of unknown function (DUF3752) [Emericellopsis cladophorae]|uniref:DUF3752 domain-containing protein n=1 Tax=Emericellopsis cladophorae TaxID=2686198 RepID=A0A9P9Y423_9HYPO|nr:Protein of unknown function (DUF3752) [Emericellopsis cladophorae]KAI6783253.1 Protein of unknown function (DUF3752) [Emericellopsis cladophorae]